MRHDCRHRAHWRPRVVIITDDTHKMNSDSLKMTRNQEMFPGYFDERNLIFQVASLHAQSTLFN